MEGDEVLVHWKMETCISIDPKAVCEEIFEQREHLCVLHKGKNENPHWHFQGLCADVKALDKRLKEWADGHSKKIAAAKSRPVKRAKKDITPEGYQYMMKEKVPVVCSTTFSEEELEELHERSDGHNEQLKNQLYFCLMEKLKFSPEPVITVPDASQMRKYNCLMEEWKASCKKGVKRAQPALPQPKTSVVSPYEPKAIHKQARLLAMDHYLELCKLPPPNLQKLILWHILRIAVEKVPTTLVGVYKEYVGQRI